jgi:hypothetical protein
MVSAIEQMYWKLPYEVRRKLLKAAFPGKYRQLQALRRVPPEGRAASLKPFVEHECIFIHIPKTAGIAVNAGLFGGDTGFHRTISGYQAIFSQAEFTRYFKFAFVRNPWDRLVSAYFFLKGGGLHDGDRRWAAHHLAPFDSFDAFVRGWVTPDNIRLGKHFRPQADYLCLPGKATAELDFIGFFENLHDDYEYVREALGTGRELAAKNVTHGKGRDYRSYYTDETRRRVAEVYRRDLELLGYTFDNSSLPTQLERRPI